jgi:hypothetical protein
VSKHDEHLPPENRVKNKAVSPEAARAVGSRVMKRVARGQGTRRKQDAKDARQGDRG